MAQPVNSMDIFKALPKTNCRACNAPSCLAFSMMVIKGESGLGECPHLAKDLIKEFEKNLSIKKPSKMTLEEQESHIKSQVKDLDFEKAAERSGGRVHGDKIIVKIFGKDFGVGRDGIVSSDIHIHPWITVPVLGYIIKGAGLKPRGNWVPMKELSGGKKWQRLFAQRCEKPIQKVADKNPGLFEDILQIFNGCNPGSHFNSDISLVLHPLPKVPMLICYWKPEQMMGSDLSLFFDSTAEENLDIDYLYTIGSGFATMLEKLFLKHG